MLRDVHNICIQDGDDEWLSGGDSAFTTGLMALTGSVEDVFLMRQFIIDGKLVRHPYQARWNSPRHTSRDQVIAFFAGTLPYKIADEKIQKSCLDYANSWFVNKDILMPADKYYLFRCAGEPPPFWLKPLAYINQALSILWDSYIKPDHEMNQSVCKNIAFGKNWIKALYKLHPNLYKNISDYYSGWRKKEALGNSLISYISYIVQK